MFARRSARVSPMPHSFLSWQVDLRRHTMLERGGMPHVGVAPVLQVFAPGVGHGTTSHSIICGLLPAPEILETRTREFRDLYERHLPQGSRAIYDAGLQYLKPYYSDPAKFDPSALTTLLPSKGHVVTCLHARPECTLLFYVFDLHERSEIHRFRCTQLHCIAEVHQRGPVYENVWWHNALFHGPVDEHVVVRFTHVETFDTMWGRLEEVS